MYLFIILDIRLMIIYFNILLFLYNFFEYLALTKDVTMSTIFINPAGQELISFIWMIENKTLKKKKFSR